MKPSCLIDGKLISHSTKLHLSKCICDQTFCDTQQLSLSKNRTLFVNDTYAKSCYFLKHYLIFPDKISSTSIPTWTSPKAFGSKITYKSTSILIMALVIRPASAVLPDATTTSVSSEPKPELALIIVGAILGAITLLILIFPLWFYVLRKRRRSQKLGHTPQSLPLVDYPSVHSKMAVSISSYIHDLDRGPLFQTRLLQLARIHYACTMDLAHPLLRAVAMVKKDWMIFFRLLRNHLRSHLIHPL